MTRLISLIRDEKGATAIEYGLIAAIVGVGIITGLGYLKDGLEGVFEDIKGHLEGAGASG